MKTAVAYRFTIFELDGITPWFGSVDVYGEITEADFQTPDPTLAHDRPYLKVPENFAPTEIDFLNGSSRIGAGSVGVLDKRITAADQGTGLVTSRIKDAPGSRAVLERWVEATATWRRIIEGVIHSYTVDSDELLVYWFHLRDAREFERAQPLFYSNHVIFSADGATGPAIDYGRLPGGGFLLGAAVEPYPTTFTVGFGSGPGLAWGVADGPQTGFQLAELGNPTQDADGIWRHKDFRVGWRPQGSSDPYTVLGDMPRPSGAGHAVGLPNALPGGVFGGTFFRPASTLFMGSEDEADIPTDGQAIELLIYAVHITPETPFWWDGGTLGDLLQEIVDGLHTDEPPKERYDAAALAAFALSSKPARMRLTAPVTDRRKWVEENIYKASFTAPAFNVDKELRPVAWRTPTLAELADAPVLDAETIQPIGEWEHGTDNAVAEVEFTYIRESLAPLSTIMSEREEGWWLWKETIKEMVVDPADDRAPWQRLVETPVVVRSVDADATPGAQKLVYAPVTIRSIASTEGTPDGPDTQDELGAQIAEEARATVFPRFRHGAPKYAAEVTATAANLDLYDGQWVLVRASWLPSKGRRDLSRWMQIYAISDMDPSRRRVSLVDGTPDFSGDPDVANESGEDCFSTSGGLPGVAAAGRALRVFKVDGLLVNSCAHPVTVRALLIAGGGGGGTTGSAGGGGGAGGVLSVTTVLIGASQTIPVTVGEGGSGANGEDSVIWVGPTGLALTPGVDPAPAATRAIGGGYGVGGSGGSGGGGNGTLPISGGSAQPPGEGTIPQGQGGGYGTDSGGIATCQAAAGGGGGSYAEAGHDGVSATPAVGGVGGVASTVPGWNVTAGGGGTGGAANAHGALGDLCGPELSVAGAAGQPGYGGGGGGKGVLAAAGDGRAGVVVIEYVGAAPTLPPPPVTSTEVTAENQVRVCIEEEDWPAVALEGYRVRVEYAVGATEPGASSGDWRLAGYLEAPGCVTSVPVPTGSKVWTRATAEAGDFLPSEPGDPGDQDTPETPGLLAVAVRLDAAGLGTVTWEPNLFAGGVRIRGDVHAQGASTARPLPSLAALDAADLSYQVLEAVPQGDYLTVDVEAWSAYEEPVEAVPLLADSFTRADSSTLGGAWTERSGDWSIASNRLQITDAVSGRTLENAAASVGPSFLQGIMRTSLAAGRPGLMGRFSWNAGAPLGYELQMRPDVDQWWLNRRDAASLDLGAVEDGYVYNGAAVCAGIWSAVQGGAGSSSGGYGWSRTTTWLTARIRCCNVASNYSDIVRSIICIDVSAEQPANEAVLTVRVLAKVETLAGQSVALVGATPGSPTTLAAADYTQLGTTLYSDTVPTLASITAGTFITFTLNDAGRAALAAAIAGSGYFCVGLRIEADRANAEPTWGSDQEAKLEIASLNNATSTFRPKLTLSAPALDTAGNTIAVDTDYPVQLYVADGVQEAWANGSALSAADTAFDAQNARTMALRHGAATGTPVSVFDDLLWFASKSITVTGLPTGWKAKVLNAALSVVATATESSGTATIDCSRFGGATEMVPLAGWAHIIVTDGSNVEQDRYSGTIYPGTTASFDDESNSLVLSGEGRIYRVSVLNPVRELVTFDDEIAWAMVSKVGSSVADLADWPADGVGALTNDGAGNLTWETSGPHTLASHTDVDIAGIASGELLVWNGTDWINQTLAEAGISAVGHTHALTALTGWPANAAGVLTNDGAGVLTWGAGGGAAAAGTLTGTTLASNVVTSSLTTIGTLVAGAVPASLLTGSLAYARLPTGAGSWDTGAGNLLTITRSLTVGDIFTVGATAMQVRTSNNRVGIGTTTGSFTLAIGGDKTIEFSGAGNAVLLNDNGYISIKPLGVLAAVFTDTQVRYADGNAGSPIFSFSNETNVGIWRSAAGVMTMQGSLKTTALLTIGTDLVLTSPTVGTTVGAAGAGSALPATPQGYWSVTIAGTVRKIPYYIT